MQGKFYQTRICPEISPNRQHEEAFAAEDVLFGWSLVEIPRGTARLVSAMASVRPKGDANVTPNPFAFDLWFADDDRITLPTVNSGFGSNTGIPIKDMIGAVQMPVGGYRSMGTNDSISFCVSGPNATEHDSLYLSGQNDLVIKPKASLDLNANATVNLTTGSVGGRTSHINRAGYGYFYIMGIAKGAFDFRSLIQINDANINTNATTNIRCDGTGMDIREHFAVGDTLGTNDGITLGEIASLAGNETTFALVDATSGKGDSSTVDDDDYLYTTCPIEIILNWEY